MSTVSGEELQEVQYAMYAAWQGIGPDVFDALGETTIDRDSLIEMILDGSHYQESLSSDLFDRFKHLSLEQRLECARGAFPDEEYCY